MSQSRTKIPKEKWAINKARSNKHEKGPQSFFCTQEANHNASTLSALTKTQSAASQSVEQQQHTNIGSGKSFSSLLSPDPAVIAHKTETTTPDVTQLPSLPSSVLLH